MINQCVVISRPHNCDESQGDGEVKLACGCMLLPAAGAFSHLDSRPRPNWNLPQL